MFGAGEDPFNRAVRRATLSSMSAPSKPVEIAFLRRLRAVRQFTSDALPDHVVADLLDVAR